LPGEDDPPQVAISIATLAMHSALINDFIVCYLKYRQPGDLGVLRGVIYGFSEEARTRGFASLTFVSFAFVDYLVSAAPEKPSILGCT